MTHQVALTIIAQIEPGKLDELKNLLESIGKDVEGNSIIPFTAFSTVHFARFVILEEAKDVFGNVIPASLVYSTEIDAPLEKHLDELLDLAGEGLDRIFSYCEGYPAPAQRNRQNRLAYLRDRTVPIQAFYVNTVGRTVKQVRQEAEVRDKLEAFLDRQQEKPGWAAQNAIDVRRAIINFVNNELSWARTPAEQPSLGWRIKEKLNFILTLLGLLALSPILLPFLPIWLVILRYKEKQDAAQQDQSRLSDEQRGELAIREDHVVQNQFSAVGNIKPGLFRHTTVMVLLWAVNFATRHVFNNGNLAGIKALNLDGVDTIHFARWIVINEGRRVLFLSNYDGSLESYMDDFINKVAWGLNAVFSNGVEYPKTRWLILDGAKDEQAFKTFIRKRQIPTQVWYTAYKEFTAVNVANNAQIRAGLHKDLNQQETEEWLRRL